MMALANTPAFRNSAHRGVHENGRHAPHGRAMNDGLEMAEVTALTVRDEMRRRKDICHPYSETISLGCPECRMEK